MKAVVIGGTGLIGSKLVNKLCAMGHETMAASPNTGVDTITGAGLREALAGARVVVDVSNSPSFEDNAVMDFFTTSTRNLLTAEKEAGVTQRRLAAWPRGGYAMARLSEPGRALRVQADLRAEALSAGSGFRRRRRRYGARAADGFASLLRFADRMDADAAVHEIIEAEESAVGLAA